MQRYRSQAGATLVMVVGIIAALGIMAASLVALTANSQHNTLNDRQQTRSFAAAEAALDDGMATLSRQWPEEEALAPVFDTTAEDAFTTRYVGDGGSGEYSDFRVHIWYFDDQDMNGDAVVNADDYIYDQDGNDRMYVEAQATVGGETTRVRALVQRDTVSFEIPRGTAWYTEGDLRTHGGSEVIGVDAGGEPPPGYAVKGFVGGDYTNQGSTSYSPDVSVYIATAGTNEGNLYFNEPVPGVDEMINPRILDYLQMAAQPDNYYTDPSDVSDHYIPPTLANPEPDDLTGLVYIDSTQLARYQLHGVFNSEEHPGILIIRGGSLEFTGGGEYYGIVFVDGGTTDLGNVVVHGAVICAGGASSELGGSQTIRYNDKVWLNLNEEITLAAKIVPNSWREIPPTTMP